MGIVYRTKLEGLGTPGAIKILTGDAQNETNIRRFVRESQLLSRLRHKNIVRVLDAGELDGRFFFVMEFITLEELLHQEEALELSRGFAILCGIADALDEAHQHDIVHRDVKPANILIDTNDNPIVMDFGLGKDLGGGLELTQKGRSLGTPHYMSPEQVQGTTGDEELSDVYSLGVMAYRVLTGKRPFDAERVIDLFAQILSATPEPPSKFAKGLGRKHDKAILKAMSRDPADRYQSMEELAEKFKSFRPKRSLRRRSRREL